MLAARGDGGDNRNLDEDACSCRRIWRCTAVAALRSPLPHFMWAKISWAMQWSWHWVSSSNWPLQSPLPSVRMLMRVTHWLYSDSHSAQWTKHRGFISSSGSFNSSPGFRCGAWYFGKCWKKLGLYEKLMASGAARLLAGGRKGRTRGAGAGEAS